jgi:hypothetical protein
MTNKRSTAITAKLLAGLVTCTTPGANELKRLPTLGAESSPFTIFGPARGATHRLPPRRERRPPAYITMGRGRPADVRTPQIDRRTRPRFCSGLKWHSRIIQRYERRTERMDGALLGAYPQCPSTPAGIFKTDAATCTNHHRIR